jgi:hypothetical protein
MGSQRKVKVETNRPMPLVEGGVQGVVQEARRHPRRLASFASVLPTLRFFTLTNHINKSLSTFVKR